MSNIGALIDYTFALKPETGPPRFLTMPSTTYFKTTHEKKLYFYKQKEKVMHLISMQTCELDMQIYAVQVLVLEHPRSGQPHTGIVGTGSSFNEVKGYK